ncbi:hypothetical protein D9615_006372 [Tricholomella constricta]|uniref:Uncharacterized protein n=1 Tax=Tricholomella constricta TaxID=117010 RepID=A0A8H5H624_9AGAR|nr:hypothetical protein D9615_006372 [Tricholomella constricta]
MARATRSATTTATKRKRLDDAEDDDQRPPSKLSRHDDAQTEHSSAMLAVLEMMDTQGLLDRVFPVLDRPDYSASLRTLLGDGQPLSVLRAAVQHLLPISSLPRAKPSATATQLLRFCNLAFSLLDQASTPIQLSLDSILPPNTRPSSPRPHRYALVQHLPTRDYWTSLNSHSALTTALKRLPTAHAELVAIFPTPVIPPKDPVPTIAAYASTRPLPSIKPLPAQRTLSTGAFLDYGPYASFAPSFDHNAEVVARRELGLALYASHERRQRRLEANEARGSIEEVFTDPGASEPARRDVDLDSELQELLPPEDAATIKAALGSLELENAVQELLERNRAALVRLEELQIARLVGEGEHSKAEEGSEEWDTAQGIMDSLAVLASLRPRASSAKRPTPDSVLPPPSVLHKLHRTLALEPTQGWYGTLPPSTSTTHPAALRDDTTVKKSRSAPVVPATPAPAAPTPTVAITTPVVMPYSGYTYAYGSQQQQQQQPYRPPATATTNGTAQTQYSQYTPQYYAYAPPTQGVGVGVPVQQSYYGQQQQGYAAAAYSGWYNAYHQQAQVQQQQAQAQGQGGSGSGTPQPQSQPQMQMQMQMQPTYGSFFGGARTPAVANTVYAPVGAQGQAAATPGLPPHLRTASAQGQGQGAGQQQGYYAQAAAAGGGYQAAGVGR